MSTVVPRVKPVVPNMEPYGKVKSFGMTPRISTGAGAPVMSRVRPITAGSPPIPPLPELMAQNGGERSILARKRLTEQRLAPEQRKHVGRDLRRERWFRLGSQAHLHRRQERIQRFHLFQRRGSTKCLDVRRRHRIGSFASLRVVAPDHDQRIRRLVRQRLEQNGTDDGEHCAVRANAKGQRVPTVRTANIGDRRYPRRRRETGGSFWGSRVFERPACYSFGKVFRRNAGATPSAPRKDGGVRRGRKPMHRPGCESRRSSARGESNLLGAPHAIDEDAIQLPGKLAPESPWVGHQREPVGAARATRSSPFRLRQQPVRTCRGDLIGQPPRFRPRATARPCVVMR